VTGTSNGQCRDSDLGLMNCQIELIPVSVEGGVAKSRMTSSPCDLCSGVKPFKSLGLAAHICGVREMPDPPFPHRQENFVLARHGILEVSGSRNYTPFAGHQRVTLRFPPLAVAATTSELQLESTSRRLTSTCRWRQKHQVPRGVLVLCLGLAAGLGWAAERV